MGTFRMPALGADMSAGTLTAWLCKPGDEVRRGDVIAIVETDKADIEVEVWQSGVVERLLVEPGTKVPVGTPLAVILAPGEEPPELPEAPPEAPAPPAPSPLPAARQARARTREAERLLISPSARQLAQDLGVDISSVTGTGPGGRIQRQDVEAAARERAQGAPVEDRATRMRRAIAAAMERSNREIPHFYVAQTIDLRRALSWLETENLKRPVTRRLLTGVLLVKAVARALREIPELNGFCREGRVERSDRVHVGVAISLRGGGLVAPALHDADRASLDELMTAFRDLVGRARAGSLRSSELADPSITVTSLGEQGVESVYPVIFPPQIAIVGFGKVVERPWAENGELVIRPLCHATVAADHRVVDGHRAGLFLAAVDRLLQDPEAL